LRLAGVETLDLTPLFLSTARDGIASNRYVFLLDDTHWNPAGIDVAAGAIADHLAWRPPGS
ncbi:MAG TPA: hypothetical protein VGR00_08925, partial [Thermoanaerobaculia bacterium]|nr:hypothetical protein [Thermoanaerobaculia bacterium]